MTQNQEPTEHIVELEENSTMLILTDQEFHDLFLVIKSVATAAGCGTMGVYLSPPDDYDWKAASDEYAYHVWVAAKRLYPKLPPVDVPNPDYLTKPPTHSTGDA